MTELAAAAAGGRSRHQPASGVRSGTAARDPGEDGVWSARDTTPTAIDQALRDLLVRYHARIPAHAPARALTLLVVVKSAEHAALESQLTRVARRYASRTIVCLLEPRRRTLDASARLVVDDRPAPGAWSFSHEHVLIAVGEHRLAHLASIVRPLVLSDVPTLTWSPANSLDQLRPLLPLADAVLLDTVAAQATANALQQASELAEQAEVVDLAWLRSVPWRERVAALFDPPSRRAELGAITGVHVRHHPRSLPVAALFAGWLAAQLGWTPSPLETSRGGTLAGSAAGPHTEIGIELCCVPATVPGLAGITITTARGSEFSLNRGPGGLRAHHRIRGRPPIEWTLLGASRGEPGILRDGIREALLRDPTYRAALGAAAAMLDSVMTHE